MQNSKKRELYYLLREYQREKRLKRRRSYNHSYLREGNYRHRYLNETFEQDMLSKLKQYLKFVQKAEEESAEIAETMKDIKFNNKQAQILKNKMIEELQEHHMDNIILGEYIVSLIEVPEYARVTDNYKQLFEYVQTLLNTQTRRVVEQYREARKQLKRAAKKTGLQVKKLQSENVLDIIKNLWYKLRGFFNHLKKYHKLIQSLPEIPWS